MNGTPSRPAASMVLSRSTGDLSGQAWCAMPGFISRLLTVSSIMPMDPETSRSSAISASVSVPALTWGISEVCASTSLHASMT